MKLLKSILAILLLAMATTSTPLLPCGGRNFGTNIKSQVNASSTQLKRGLSQIQVLKDADFYVPSGLIPRSSGSAKKFRRQDEYSPEVMNLDGDDYFHSDGRRTGIETPRRNQALLRKDSTHPRLEAPGRGSLSDLHIRRRHPGHPSVKPRSRNEGEYGYNYQGGNGDVQIHQHIHEYRFNDATTGSICILLYSPVCGTKWGVSQTYGNSCVMEAAGATKLHDGEC